MNLRFFACLLAALVSPGNAQDLETIDVSDTIDDNRRLLAPTRRRSGQLHFVSPHASQADCAQDIQLQLFPDWTTLNFKADAIACKTGTRFFGSVEDGNVHLNLVPGRAGGGSFGAVVRFDDTGGVYDVSLNANEVMFVKEYFQEDFPPEEVEYAETQKRDLKHDTLVTSMDEDETYPMDVIHVQDDTRSLTAETSFQVTGRENVDAMDGNSHLRHRKLWGLSVNRQGLVQWDCGRKKKDTVCWKKTSTSGSPCRNGPGNQEIYTGKAGICTFNIPNWECNTEYKVRVRKNWFNYLTVTITSEPCSPPPPPSPTPATQIDLLVLWTADAECAASFLPTGCTRTPVTENNIRTRIDTAIQVTNGAFDLSGIYAEMNLAHAAFYDYQEVSNKESLTEIRLSEVVDDLRDDHCADMVQMFTNIGGGIGRINFRRPQRKDMFTVTSWWGSATDFVTAHELGHNFMCEHDRGTEDECDKDKKYAYGYRDPSAQFRTIMAYSCKSTECDNNPGGSCPRIQRFSTPYGDFNGNSIGNAKNDCARRINASKARVASFGCQPKCMAGTLGFTKVTKVGGAVTSSETKQLQDLEVGDNLVGLSAGKSEVDECEVLSLTSKGNGIVYDKYTSDHYILSPADSDTLVTHGETTAVGQEVPVYQVLTSCPVVKDEHGRKSTFSICGDALYGNGPMPWSAYLKIHKTMYSLVKKTGLRELSALNSIDDATECLPVLCTMGLACIESGEDCDVFEEQMVVFVNNELVPEARAKVLEAFPELGFATKEGSISYMVSEGMSSWGWYPDFAGGCKRDGNHPYYMETYDGWLTDSLESCCEQHAPWAYDACLTGNAQSSGPSGKFFADYRNGKCLQDCVTGPFGCARVPPPVALYDSIDSCCDLALSSVDTAFCYSRSSKQYTNAWVVDYTNAKCAMDCDPNDGAPCSEALHSNPYATIYATPQECCQARLGWVNLDACIAKSENVEYSSDKFYPDYIGLKCGKDCDPSLGLPCTGSPPSYTGVSDLFDTDQTCCEERLGWIDLDKCVADTNGIALQAQGSGEWYVDWNVDNGTCVKDCATGEGCGGLKESWAPGFPTASACCASIPWKVDNCHI